MPMGKIHFGLWCLATVSLALMEALPVMLVDCTENNGFWNMKASTNNNRCFSLELLKKSYSFFFNLLYGTPSYNFYIFKPLKS
jgi:hypothetical protein